MRMNTGCVGRLGLFLSIYGIGDLSFVIGYLSFSSDPAREPHPGKSWTLANDTHQPAKALANQQMTNNHSQITNDKFSWEVTQSIGDLLFVNGYLSFSSFFGSSGRERG